MTITINIPGQSTVRHHLSANYTFDELADMNLTGSFVTISLKDGGTLIIGPDILKNSIITFQ